MILGERIGVWKMILGERIGVWKRLNRISVFFINEERSFR